MLSKDAIKLLKWFKRRDRWMSPDEIKMDCRIFNDRSFKALISEKMIENQFTESGNHWAKYRISDSGKAYLEGLRAKRLPELREWLNVAIGFVTFFTGVLLSDSVKSFFRWVWEMIT